MKSALFLHFFQFEDDKLFQAVAAYNLANGKGLTYSEVRATDFHTEINHPLNRWPPGYSMIVSVIYTVTGNLIASTLILDLIAIFGFLLVLLKLLQELDFPLYLINLLMLFNGFTIAIYLSQPTDLHALVFVLASIYLAIRFYKHREAPIRSGLLIGLFCFLSAFLRYMYIPTSIIPGLILTIAGILRKDQGIIRGGFICLAATVVLNTAMLIFNTLYAGSPTYIMPMEKGFFPSNLFTLYPFFYGAFINLNFFITQLSLRIDNDYTFWFNCLVYLNIFTFGFCLLKMVSIRRSDIPKSFTPYHLFVIITVTITLLIIILSGYLSIFNGRKITLKNVGLWTFIGDGRYFAFVMVMIPVIAGHFLFASSANGKIRFLRYAFVSLMIIEIIHTGYFLVRKSNFIQPIKNATLPLALKEYLQKRIYQLKKEEVNVVVTGHRETIANWAALNGAKALLDSDELIVTRKTPDPGTVLLLVIKKEDIPFYQTYLSDSGSQPDTSFAGFYVYSNPIDKYDRK